MNFPHLIKVAHCSICIALQASFTAVVLINDWSPWAVVHTGSALVPVMDQQEIVADCKRQPAVFFTIKWKPALFVSSGPKPCEACRQEEIYEEPISILNSNEVSCEECQHRYFLRRLPCNLYIIPHPHSVSKGNIRLQSGGSFRLHNATYYVWLLLYLVALWVHWTVFFAPPPGISRQCCRSRNSKSSCQVFEPGLRLDRLNKRIWGEV